MLNALYVIEMEFPVVIDAVVIVHNSCECSEAGQYSIFHDAFLKKTEEQRRSKISIRRFEDIPQDFDGFKYVHVWSDYEGPSPMTFLPYMIAKMKCIESLEIKCGMSWDEIFSLDLSKVKRLSVSFKGPVKAINQMVSCTIEMTDKLIVNIKQAIADDNTGELETLNALIGERQKELVKLLHAKKDYSEIADEIDRLRDKKRILLAAKAENEGFKKRIKELEKFLRSQPKELTEFDDNLTRKYITEILISDKRFRVRFKAGIDIDIDRK